MLDKSGIPQAFYSTSFPWNTGLIDVVMLYSTKLWDVANFSANISQLWCETICWHRAHDQVSL